MFQYFSRFLIQIVPSVTATVIGGFIVHTWISPRVAVGTSRPAVVSTATPGIAGEAADAGADAARDAQPETKADAKPLNIKGGPMLSRDAASKDASKNASKDTAPASTADPKLRGSTEAVDKRHATKPASADKEATDKSHRDRIWSEKNQPKAAAIPASITPEAVAIASPAEEKRNASELARTALERLRAVETPRPDPAKAAIDPHQAGPHPVIEPAQHMVPQPAVLPMGPPINILAPRQADAAVERDDAQEDAGRVVPPGDIPQMRRTAEALGDGRPSIADDVVSATRSVLRAVLPK